MTYENSMFINKVSLEHSLFIYVLSMAAFVYNGRFARLRQRPDGLQSLKYLLSGPLQKMLAKPPALLKCTVCLF